MSGLILYQRDDCHLCDQALAVLAQARAPEFDSVFIDDDEALVIETALPRECTGCLGFSPVVLLGMASAHAGAAARPLPAGPPAGFI